MSETLGPDRVTTIATLIDIVPGTPPAIITGERFRLKSGGTKTFTQKVPVLDPTLYQRLVAEVAKGDEVEITVETDWSKPGLPKHLAGFSRVLTSATRPASG